MAEGKDVLERAPVPDGRGGPGLDPSAGPAPRGGPGAGLAAVLGVVAVEVLALVAVLVTGLIVVVDDLGLVTGWTLAGYRADLAAGGGHHLALLGAAAWSVVTAVTLVLAATRPARRGATGAARRWGAGVARRWGCLARRAAGTRHLGLVRTWAVLAVVGVVLAGAGIVVDDVVHGGVRATLAADLIEVMADTVALVLVGLCPALVGRLVSIPGKDDQLCRDSC